jgi:hypothetical protein
MTEVPQPPRWLVAEATPTLRMIHDRGAPTPKVARDRGDLAWLVL